VKVVATVLCLALAAAWVRPARADEEIRPSFEGLEPGRDADETYRLNALGIVHEGMSASFPTIFVGRGRWWRPVRGKFRWPTAYDDFYLKMGRADLGARDRHRRVLASTLDWGGLLITVGGLALFLSGLGGHHTTRVEVGLGMFVGGFAVSTVGSRIQPPLVSEEDADAMVNEYNRRLQLHLGLAPVGTRSDRDRDGDRSPIGLTLSRRW